MADSQQNQASKPNENSCISSNSLKQSRFGRSSIDIIGNMASNVADADDEVAAMAEPSAVPACLLGSAGATTVNESAQTIRTCVLLPEANKNQV